MFNMDILQPSTLNAVTLAFKVLFFIAGSLILLINYFQSKEAAKMERKLNIALPGSMQFAISFQLLASIIFVFASIFILLFS